MKIKPFILAFLIAFGIAAVYAAGVLAQPADLSQPAPVMQTNGNALMGDSAFKEWLLADTNALITRFGVWVSAALVILCVLFLAGLVLLWQCCRRHASAKCLFDRFKLENCQNQGRFGMFIYNFRNERIKASGHVCALLGLKNGDRLAKDKYLRLLRNGVDISGYEDCYTAELVYEREPGAVFISLYVFPIVNKRGVMVGEYGVLQDISPFRHSELAYRTRHAEAKEAFNSVEAYITGNPLHAMVLHDGFDIIRMNKAAIDILGADEDEYYSMCFKAVLEGGDMLAAFAKHLSDAHEYGFAMGRFKMFDKERNIRQVEVYTSKFKTTDHGDMLNSSLRVME